MIAIITGASSGLGAEFARQLDSENLAELWLIARDELALGVVANSLTTTCRIISCDLSSETEIDSKIGSLLESIKPEIKYCVNNAGFGKIGPLHLLKREDMTSMIDVNCRAVVQLSHMVIPYMKSGSCLIHTSSAASFAPLGGFAVYAATKAFVTSFSVAIQAELVEMGIHSIAVCPGPIETDFSRRAHQGSVRSDSVMKKKVDAVPVIRKAIRDAKKKKSVSLYGFKFILMPILCKFISPKFLADISYRKVMKTPRR